MDALSKQWESKKGLILGLVIGLLVGPLISGIMGWQVSRAYLTRMVHGAVMEQQVAFCDLRARAAVKNPGKLEYSDRYELAKIWAKMPGQQGEVDSDVVSACTNGLAG
jgi:hypothetical protein